MITLLIDLLLRLYTIFKPNGLVNFFHQLIPNKSSLIFGSATLHLGGSQGLTRSFPGGSDGTQSAANAGDLGLIPGWEDPLEEETATHSSFLPGEFADRGFSQATVHEVAKLDTREQTNSFRD